MTAILIPHVPLEFVRIPAGEFLMGSDKAKDTEAYDDELPQHKLYLPDYCIGKYPVTVAQFAAFVKATGYKSIARRNRGKKANHPMTLVSWDDAVAFCKWANCRLPTEAEWEKAARGSDGRLYPWGNDAPNSSLLNYNGNVGDTTPVGSYPNGDNSCGCADMAGNVWEWCSSLYRPYPYQSNDGRENPKDCGLRVVRGGSFNNYRRIVRSACRNGCDPNSRSDDGGFRVVCASPIFL